MKKHKNWYEVYVYGDDGEEYFGARVLAYSPTHAEEIATNENGCKRVSEVVLCNFQ
jgi:hypothetical protein